MGTLYPQTNILIADDGRPCLTDIGLNASLSAVIYPGEWPIPSGWMFKSPEELLLQGDSSIFLPTKAMDVYAFASTIYTIMTSKPPFRPKLYGKGILEILLQGHTVEQPGEITDALWNVLKMCWSYRPDERLSMSTVQSALALM